ncbi:MAG: glycoside hydrolase family 127 protein, partial [Lentisphaeria bacterium]|nr:glycoside hydrolase family 127 protein [Lentisphaeria bacterium]
LVREKELFITGGGGLKDANGEFWYNGTARQCRTDCGGMGETCITATWLWFSAAMSQLTGDSTVIDDLERSFYNALLGAFTPDGANVTHINPFLCGGWKRPAGEQISDFPGHDCCRAQGPYGLSLAPRIAVMKTDGGYAVNLYEDLTAEGILKITGGYPASDNAVITVLKDGEFELALRIPRDFGCRVDGHAVSGGTYHRLKRQWKAGTRIELEFDFSPRIEELNGMTATLCGPLVMCRECGGKPGRSVLRSCCGKADYASAGMGFAEENTLTVWENRRD